MRIMADLKQTNLDQRLIIWPKIAGKSDEISSLNTEATTS